MDPLERDSRRIVGRMSFLENLLLNYLPLAAILGGMIWYFRRSKRNSPAPIPDGKDTVQILPEVQDRLRCFTHDVSGGQVDLTAFARQALDITGFKLLEVEPPLGWDAYFAAACFIAKHRPAGVDYYEGRTGERSLKITPYWEVQNA